LVADTSRGLQVLFRQVVAGCILAAVLMAIIAMQLFMRPLRGILGAIERIGPGQYDVVIADSGRRDEFGTLAQAFNAMMVGLREKELLGRYVPESVKLLVADSQVQAKARLGEQRRVTVLFSAVSGPEGDDDIGPDQVFQHMNAHLASMVAAVDEAGGEISKVMGEKIMVVLDHATMGGNEAVADACLRLIDALRRRAQEAGVAVEIGVNTGDVIAGILGSPAVRLDYTVIGDTVNLASRLALLAQTVTGSRVVVSGASRDLLAGRATATRLPIKQVKGKTQAVEVFLLDLA